MDPEVTIQAICTNLDALGSGTLTKNQANIVRDDLIQDLEALAEWVDSGGFIPPFPYVRLNVVPDAPIVA